MKSTYRSVSLFIVVVIASITHFATETRAGGGSTAAVLAKLENAGVDWKTRLRSLVEAAQASSDSVPMLIEAIERGVPAQREFAAQALGLILDPATRPALQKAAEDEQRSVRSFAERALRAVGPAGTKPFTRAASIRETVANYDLAQLDSARVGEISPDFELGSARGKPIRLSQYRGQTVVLEFNRAND